MSPEDIFGYSYHQHNMFLWDSLCTVIETLILFRLTKTLEHICQFWRRQYRHNQFHILCSCFGLQVPKMVNKFPVDTQCILVILHETSILAHTCYRTFVNLHQQCQNKCLLHMEFELLGLYSSSLAHTRRMARPNTQDHRYNCRQ